MDFKVFFCYAHEDELFLNKLKAHLNPLQEEGLVSFWHDRDISAGTEWEREIVEQLETAQLILLLVSPDFMNSKYCYGIEMKRAMELHERGEAIVIPIILRSTYWQSAPFGKLQVLPKDAKPVRSWRDMDKAFLNVVDGIRNVINQSHLKETFRPSDFFDDTLSYKFRSPLEAKWAVFFDRLGIEYSYEYKPLRFKLERTFYLPDFYLPTYRYFLKITQSTPTPEEQKKAQLLALYYNVETFILSGDIWIPGSPNSYEVDPYGPPYVYTYPLNLGYSPLYEIETSLEVKIVLQKLFDYDIKVKEKNGILTLYSTEDKREFSISRVQDHLTSTGYQRQMVLQLIRLLKKQEKEIIKALTPSDGWKCDYLPQEQAVDPTDMWAWCQCSSCGAINIVAGYIDWDYDTGSVLHHLHTGCPNRKKGVFLTKTPGLVSAYRAARQIRISNVDGAYIIQP